jgi:cytochrome P450
MGTRLAAALVMKTQRIDFISQDYYRDPAVGIEQLRRAGPVIEIRFPIVGKVWITTTYETAGRVLKDSESFTLRKEGGGLGLPWWMPRIVRTLANNMLTMDEPDHARLRGIVDEAFRRRAILEMEPRILAIADELAGELFADGSPADIVERYARKLPLSVICELLGLPLADRPKFLAWASTISRITGSLVSFWHMMRGLSAMRPYLAERLQAARAHGGEGLIAELVRVEKEGGRISPDEMIAMVFLLLGAGSETTTHLISGSVYELVKNPTLRDWLEEDWSRANLAVEEFLRVVSPVQFSKPRFVRKDIELDGVRLKKGDKIMAMVAAANMDPKANEHPERLDLQRHPNRHLAFGTGVHFCLGYQLARIEGKCALQALFGRWPKLELAIEPADVRWRKRPGLRAIEKLPVRAHPQ